MLFVLALTIDCRTLLLQFTNKIDGKSYDFFLHFFFFFINAEAYLWQVTNTYNNINSNIQKANCLDPQSIARTLKHA